MNPTIDIKSSGNTTKHTAVFEEGSVRHIELMKEDYVKLVFSTNLRFPVELGDNIYLEDWGGRFEITTPQQPKYNPSTGGYDYDLQFNAPHYKWNNKLFKFEPSSNRNEASWSLTDTLQHHMDVFLRNLSFYGWIYTLDIPNSLATRNKHIYIQYENAYLLDALTQIAEAFECEWWITDNIIHFGKCESGNPIDFLLGVNVEDMGAKDTNKDYVTRLYAFGSTKNIPANYRKNDEQLLLNGVVQKRLMLPTATPCVNIDGITDESPTEEVVEGIVVFDDVLPRMTNTTITSVDETTRTVERTETTVEASVENDTVSESNESETEDVTIYRFKSSGLTFRESYLLAGTQLQVQFQSGLLNGMTFDLAFNPDGAAETIDNNGTETVNPDSQWFEIVRNDTYGLMLPNDTLKPASGDSFILIGWDVTKMESGMNLITQAETELYQRAQAYAAKLQIDPNTYPCTMMADYMYGLNEGVQDSNYTKVGTFPIGQQIRLNNGTFFKSGSRLSRVIGYEYKLDIPYDGAIIYVGESATYSSREKNALNQASASTSINYRGGSYGQQGGSGGGGSNFYVITSNDNSTPTDNNLYSALRTERQFARKDKDDNISSLWTFQRGATPRGIQTKHYKENSLNEDNLFGKGFELVEKNNRSRLEVDELLVRVKAFFASLEIREISYLGGNYVFSAAGSKIYHVEWLDSEGEILPKTSRLTSVAKFRCYMYSDDGTTATMNKWALNDQARCQTFNIVDRTVAQNAQNKYYWRLVVGVGKEQIAAKEDDTKEYQYVDLANTLGNYDSVSDDYPEEGDAIVQMGNWNNTSRQGIIYLDLEGTNAPAIMVYSGVGTIHFTLPDPTLLLSPKKNIIYGEFHSVVDPESQGTGTIDDQLSALISSLNDIKNQADQKFDIWFGEGVPYPNTDSPSHTANYPASEWTTDTLKALHAQDLYYDTTREAALNGGRAWRWVAVESNGSVDYVWDEVTDADTIASLEKIADVASDGKLTGGSEKTRVYIDWMKCVQEYLKYDEQAKDYDLDDEVGSPDVNNTPYKNYIAAYTALATYLNGGTAATTAILNGTTTPAWLSDLTTTTVISDPSTYRTRWSAYYTALAALLKRITEKVNEVAAAAETHAQQALTKIGDMGNDGKLEPNEKLTVKREFIASYHEMMDTDEDGYTAGILDMALGTLQAGTTVDPEASGFSSLPWKVSYADWVQPYVDAFRAVGTFLNGGVNDWEIPTLAEFNNASTGGDATLPIWIQEDGEDPVTHAVIPHISATNDINGDDWREVWAEFYSTRTALLNALTDKAQATADGAQETADEALAAIEGIALDGVLSITELPDLKREFETAYRKRSEMVSLATDSNSHKLIDTVLRTSLDAYLASFKALANYLNEGDTWTEPATYSVSNGSGVSDANATYNVAAKSQLADSDFPSLMGITEDIKFQADWSNPTAAGDDGATFRNLWADLEKKLLSLSNTLARDTRDVVNDIVSDGVIKGGREKSELLIQWVDAVGNYNKYIAQASEYNVDTSDLDTAFDSLAKMLNGNVNPTNAILIGTTLPAWLTDINTDKRLADDTYNGSPLTATTYRTLWTNFYNELHDVIAAVMAAAQALAEQVATEVDKITDDGWFTLDEVPLLKREFEAAYRKRAELIDKATDSNWKLYDEMFFDPMNAYIVAFDALKNYLNQGNAWTEPTTSPTYNISNGGTWSQAVYRVKAVEHLEGDNSGTAYNYFPSLMKASAPIEFKDVWTNQGVADKGKKFRDLWAEYSKCELALANTLVEYAQNTAESAIELAEDTVHCFVSSTIPTPPYSANDMWQYDDNGLSCLFVCQHTRTSGSGVFSDWKFSSETDLREVLAKFAENVYNLSGYSAYLAALDVNEYIQVYFKSNEPTSDLQPNDLWYNGSVLKKRSSGSWSEISDNDYPMLNAYCFLAMFVLGNDNGVCRIFNQAFDEEEDYDTWPYDYDLVMAPFVAHDPIHPNDPTYDMQGGLTIRMYLGDELVSLRESVRGFIDNFGNYIRAVVTSSTSAAGFFTTSNFASLFAQALSNNQAIAGAIGVGVTFENGVPVYSQATIDADIINFKTGSFEIENQNHQTTFGVDSNGNVEIKGTIRADKLFTSISRLKVLKNVSPTPVDSDGVAYCDSNNVLSSALLVSKCGGKLPNKLIIFNDSYDQVSSNRLNERVDIQITLPNASDFQGHEMEIFCQCYLYYERPSSVGGNVQSGNSQGLRPDPDYQPEGGSVNYVTYHTPRISIHPSSGDGEFYHTIPFLGDTIEYVEPDEDGVFCPPFVYTTELKLMYKIRVVSWEVTGNLWRWMIMENDNCKLCLDESL